jgi:hypothetical protein
LDIDINPDNLPEFILHVRDIAEPGKQDPSYFTAERCDQLCVLLGLMIEALEVWAKPHFMDADSRTLLLIADIHHFYKTMKQYFYDFQVSAFFPIHLWQLIDAMTKFWDIIDDANKNPEYWSSGEYQYSFDLDTLERLDAKVQALQAS